MGESEVASAANASNAADSAANNATENHVEIVNGGCRSCHINCRVDCYVKDGRLVDIKAAPRERGGFGFACLRGLSAEQFVYSPTRVKHPLKRIGKRGEGKWERITWDQAIEEVAQKIYDMSQKYGPETFVLPGRTGRHDMGWIAHRVARTIGTPNCYYGPIQVCLMPQFHGQIQFGSQLAQPNGCSMSDLRISVGTEAAYSWEVVSGFRQMIKMKTGAKVVVFDPVCGPAASHATKWMPVRPGTDLAWCMCMIKHLLETGTYNYDFVSKWTNAPFLVREDTGDLLRESDVKQGGSKSKYYIWDETANAPKFWDADEVQWEGGVSGRAHYDHLVELFWKNKSSSEMSPATMPENMRPAMWGEYDVVVMGGRVVKCKPVLQMLYENVSPWTFEHTAEVTWLSAADLEEVANMISAAKLIDFYEGAQYMSTNTSQFLNAMSILKMLTGNVDTPSAEMDQCYPVTPTAFPGEWDISFGEGLPIEQKRKRLGYYEHRIGCGFAFEEWSKWQPLRPENADGLLLFPDVGCVLKAAEEGIPYEVHGIIAISSNWLMHDPSTARWMRLLEDETKIQLHVVTEIVMSPTAEMADYVFPTQTWAERNYLKWGVGGADAGKQFFRRAIKPIGEAKHDYEFGAMLAQALERIDPSYNNGLLNPTTNRFFAGEYGKLWPADTIDGQRDLLCQRFLGKTLDECLEEVKVYPPDLEPCQVKYGKYKIAGKFPTDTGKCNMFSTLHYAAGYPALPVYAEPAESPLSRPDVAQKYPYVLTTGKRQAGFFHSEFRQLPNSRQINPTPEVFMNPKTAQECGVTAGDWVWVEAPESYGRAPMNKVMGRVSFRFKVLPGVVSYSQHGWWRPEKAANEDAHGALEWNCEALLQTVDSTPETGTPGLRSQLCRVYKCTQEDIEKYKPMITREQLDAFAPMTQKEAYDD